MIVIQLIAQKRLSY